MPWVAQMASKWGKGKWGKRDGKGKGKCGKGKGKCEYSDVDCLREAKELHVCARPGCGFVSTWHATHCCQRCKHSGKHGLRCARMPMVVPAGDAMHEAELVEQQPVQQVTQGDLSFPVVVEDDIAPMLVPAGDAVHEAELVKQQPLQQVTQSDLSFPVVVEDGRHLTIAWNRTDDSRQVAESFAQRHGIPLEELSTIQAFVEQATAKCEKQT